MKKGFAGIDKCLDDGGTCGLGGFCNDCPNLKQDKKMSVNVKIKLTRTLPVDDVLKCVEGAEFDARYVNTYTNDDGIEVQENVRDNPVEFEAENGETVRAFSREYQINSK